MIFDGSVSNASCTASAEDVNSLTVDSTYSSTITLQGGLYVGMGGFDFEGGNIVQTLGAVVAVGGVFTWDNPAGNATLNAASGILSDLVLYNTVTIKGTNLVTGDNIDLYSATVNFNTTGSLTFNNNAGININSGTFNWNSTANIVTTGTGVINNAGTFEKALSAGATVTSALPLINSGTLNVDQGTLAFSTAGPNGVSVEQTGGNTSLRVNGNAGAILQVANGFQMDGGLLTTGSGPNACQINGGNVTINAGNVAIGGLGSIGELTCTGLVTMNGGAYVADVDLTALTYDVWFSNKGFVFPANNTAVLSVVSLNIPAPLPKATAFPIMQTPLKNDITGDFSDEFVTIGATGQSYTAGPDGNNLNYEVTTP